MILGAAGILNRGTSCKWPEEEERRESGRSHLFDIWLRMAGVKLGERKDTCVKKRGDRMENIAKRAGTFPGGNDAFDFCRRRQGSH